MARTAAVPRAPPPPPSNVCFQALLWVVIEWPQSPSLWRSEGNCHSRKLRRRGSEGEGWLSQSLMCTRWLKANTYATINSLTHNTSVQLRAWHLTRLDLMWLIRPAAGRRRGGNKQDVHPASDWLAGWSTLIGWQFVLCSSDLWQPGSWVVVVMDDLCVRVFTFPFSYFFPPLCGCRSTKTKERLMEPKKQLFKKILCCFVLCNQQHVYLLGLLLWHLEK